MKHIITLIVMSFLLLNCDKEKPMAVAQTSKAKHITATTAVFDALAECTGRGSLFSSMGLVSFCYATHKKPTIKDSIARYPTGIVLDDFELIVGNLQPNTTYFFRVYDTWVTTYYNIESFTTLPQKTVTDSRDGKKYGIVTIDNLQWMTDDLGYNCGEGCYQFKHNEEPLPGEGKLYSLSGAKKACLPGWRIPTDDDWKALEKSAGLPNDLVQMMGWRGDESAYALKGSEYWSGKNKIKNSSGLNLLPSGYAVVNPDTSYYKGRGKYVSYLSSTTIMIDSVEKTIYREFYDDKGFISRRFEFIGNVYGAVRCVRDAE